MRSANDLSAIWLWPWTMAKANLALLETMTGVPDVIAARLPTITDAMQNPRAANPGELTRMVTEKTAAFGRSHRSLSSAARKIQAATGATRAISVRSPGAVSCGRQTICGWPSVI